MATPLLARMVREKGRAIVQTAQGRPLDDAAEYLRRKMAERIARGVGSNGRMMAPYAPSTARQKGRTQPVTLRSDRGGAHLLDTIRVVKEGKRRVIRVTDAGKARIGRYLLLGTRNMKARAWWGPTVRETKEAAQRFGAAISQTMKRTDKRYVQKIVVNM
jgi:hypothetical protein